MDIDTMIKSGDLEELSIAMNLLGINHIVDSLQYGVGVIEIPFKGVLNDDVVKMLNLCNKYNIKVKINIDYHIEYELFIFTKSQRNSNLYAVTLFAPDDDIIIKQIKDILKDNCYGNRRFNQV